MKVSIKGTKSMDMALLFGLQAILTRGITRTTKEMDMGR